MKNQIGSILIILMLGACHSPGEVEKKTVDFRVDNISNVWISDNGDGTYTNPILQADYSDPDVIRVDNDFYMTASSFNSSPGLPILHSKDLVNWQIVNHALPVLPEEVYNTPQPSKGV